MRSSGRVVAGLALRRGQHEAHGPVTGFTVFDWKKACEMKDRFEVIVGIGDNPIRREAYEEAEDVGFEFTNAVHPSVVIGSGTKIGPGTVVAAGAALVLNAEIGRGVIINTNATVVIHFVV